MVYRGEYVLVARIVGNSTPADAAKNTGPENRAARVGRGEHALVAILRDELTAPASIPEREAPGVLRREGALFNQRWGRREGLCWRCLFRRDCALRHWPFGDRGNGLAGTALEDKQHAGLGRLQDSRH